MLLIILFWLILGILCSYIAKQRGRRSALWFILGFSTGFIALLILFILPSKKEVPLVSKKALADTSSLEISGTQKKYSTLGDQIPPESVFYKLWYYLDDQNKQYGPMSFQALKRAWEEKTIHASTYVWNEDMSEWQPLKNLSSMITHIHSPQINTELGHGENS